jgi:hypothetical protein
MCRAAARANISAVAWREPSRRCEPRHHHVVHERKWESSHHEATDHAIGDDPVAWPRIRSPDETGSPSPSWSVTFEPLLRSTAQPSHRCGPILELDGTTIDLLHANSDLTPPSRLDVHRIMVALGLQALEQRARCLSAVDRRKIQQRSDELRTRGHLESLALEASSRATEPRRAAVVDPHVPRASRGFHDRR